MEVDRCGHKKLCSTGSYQVLMVVGGSDGHDSASDALELLALNPGQETDCLKNLMHPCPAKLEGAMRDYSTPSQGIMAYGPWEASKLPQGG